MNQVDLTVVRAIKFMWSVTWRMWVMSIPLVFVMGFLVRGLVGFGPDGKPQLSILFFLIYLGFSVAGIFLYIFALQHTFKTEWSDFKILIVANTKPEKINSQEP